MLRLWWDTRRWRDQVPVAVSRCDAWTSLLSYSPDVFQYGYHRVLYAKRAKTMKTKYFSFGNGTYKSCGINVLWQSGTHRARDTCTKSSARVTNGFRTTNLYWCKQPRRRVLYMYTAYTRINATQYCFTRYYIYIYIHVGTLITIAVSSSVRTYRIIKIDNKQRLDQCIIVMI